MKLRNRRNAFQQVVANQIPGNFQPNRNAPLTPAKRREIFREWNSGFTNADIRRFNEAYWRHKVRKTKTEPNHLDYGIRRGTATANRSIVDTLMSASTLTSIKS